MTDEDYCEQPQQQESMPMYEKTMADIKYAESGGLRANLANMAGQSVDTVATPHHPTITELLLYRKSCVEKELENINHALETAKKNQGAMDLLDSIAKTGQR